MSKLGRVDLIIEKVIAMLSSEKFDHSGHGYTCGDVNISYKGKLIIKYKEEVLLEIDKDTVEYVRVDEAVQGMRTRHLDSRIEEFLALTVKTC